MPIFQLSLSAHHLAYGLFLYLQLPLIILDISFLDRRGARLVAYWTCTAAGSSLLLVAVPFIIDASDGNWRINYWFWAAFAAFSLVAILLLVPETLFNRGIAHHEGRVHATDTYGTHRMFDTAEEARAAGFKIDDGESAGAEPPKTFSYKRQLSLVTIQPSAITRFLGAYRDIFACLLVPGTFWALLLNSVVFGGLVILSITYAQRLEMLPWHFSPSVVGTVQVGAAIGALVGLAYGQLTEPVSRFLTRRNHGIREPEHVLPNFVFPSVVAGVGLITYGFVGMEPEKYSWVGIHASFALFYFGFCAISAVTGIWLSELLPHTSGPAIVLVCGGRNAISFGYSSSFTSWITEMGFRDTHILFAGILLALGLLSIPLYFVNGHSRKLSHSIPFLNAY